MSDSEAEFEGTDEGINGDDGWDVESEFNLPSIQ